MPLCNFMQNPMPLRDFMQNLGILAVMLSLDECDLTVQAQWRGASPFTPLDPSCRVSDSAGSRTGCTSYYVQLRPPDVTSADPSVDAKRVSVCR